MTPVARQAIMIGFHNSERRVIARTTTLRMLAGLSIVFIAAAAAPPDVRESGRAQATQRAAATLAATERGFGVHDGTGLYRDAYPTERGAPPYSDEWPFSQVHIGVLDLAGAAVPASRDASDALRAHDKAQMLYWTDHSANGLPGFLSRVTPSRRSGGDLYYDDNAWVGLAAMQKWLVFHDRSALDRAKAIFALLRSAWDRDPDHPAPGGLFWTQAPDNHDRNTVSNMPAAELGVRLFEATGDRAYLTDALLYYRWTNRTLQRPDGLYLDHIDLRGAIDARIFTYNQGVPVGVNVLLYKATGDAHYLAEARRIADASFAYFITGKRLDTQQVAFNAIYFKNLLLLESVIGGTRFHDAMRDYALHMWLRHRDPATGLFRSPRAPRSGFHVIDQGAMIQIDAVLGWDPSRYRLLY